MADVSNITSSYGNLAVAPKDLVEKYELISRTIQNLSDGKWLQWIGKKEIVYKDLTSSWPNTHVFIVGPPGSGKTTYCRWHALTDAEHFQTNAEKIVPVYLALGQIGARREYSIETLVETTIKNSALLGDIDTASLWSDEFKIRLYLDGLDEIPNLESRYKLIETVRQAVGNHNNIQLIVTARDSIDAPWLSWLPRLSMSGLNARSLRNLVGQWFENDSVLIGSFYEQMKDTPPIQQVVKNPLLATLTILTFRRTGSLPTSVTRLYSMFTELLVGGWDIAKGVLRVSKFSRDTKLSILGQIASDSHKGRSRTFTRGALRAAARRGYGERHLDIQALEQELMTDGLIERNPLGFQFSHLSLQEFLAARAYIGSRNADEAGFALCQTMLGDTWWNEVIRFYIGLSGQPRALNDWINKEVEKVVPDPEGMASLEDYLKESYPEFKFFLTV